MLRLINLGSLDRVLINIVLFLPKHCFTFYDLRLTAFFPDLMNGFLFMRTLEMFRVPKLELGNQKKNQAFSGATMYLITPA